MTLRAALVLDGNSGPALATARSLGRAGWRVLAPRGTRTARSRYVAAAVPLVDAEDDVDAFAAGVEDVLAAQRVDVVVPATDASVETLWAHEPVLGGARVLGADRASAALGTDKVAALAAADRAGFPTPAWVAPATLDEAAAALDRIGLPAVVKPRRSYVREGGRLRQRRHGFVEDRAALADVLHRQSEPDGTLPVVQAFVRGRSLSASAVLAGGRVLALVARETLSFDPVAGGTSVWKRTVAADEVGVQDAVGLLRAIGYEGLAEVEYQVDAEGVPRLMEIGVRVHGWVPLAIHAGVDLPLVAARALLGDELPDAAPYRVGVEMRWPRGEVNRIVAALRRDGLPPGVTRGEVLRKAWPPWRPGLAYDGLVFDDPGPWVLARLRRARARRAAP
jgi:predicted ATP-grasp superfamily ATP-dependent carboligase